MEKYMTWYRLLLKMKVHSFGFFLELLAMVFLTLLITNITFPASDNTKVGIVCNGSARAEVICEKLAASSEVFEFIRLDSEDEMKEKVKRAELECGFSFAENFDILFEQENIREAIVYYCSQTTTKGSVLKESVYAAFLEEYSRVILSRTENELYGEHDADRMDRIMNRFEDYVNSEDVFGIVTCEYETDHTPKSITSKVYPLQGSIGIMVFLIVFLSGLKRWEDGFAYPCALTKGEAKRFYMTGALAFGTFPALLGLAIVWMSPDSRGFLTELFRMLCLLVYSVLWCRMMQAFFKNYMAQLASVPIFVLANVLICPAFFDIVTYVPAIKYVRILFPLGIYLY